MKSLVLSALICAFAGNSAVFSSPSSLSVVSYGKASPDPVQRVDAFKQQLSFHRRNIDMLWQQYALSVERIVNAKGSHAELDQEEARLNAGYRSDMKRGVRVAESEKAIEKIAAKYARKHARRDAAEKAEMARLQELLCIKLDEEKRLFDASKRKYADVINEQTRPLLQEVEQRFSQLIAQANALGNPENGVIAAQ